MIKKIILAVSLFSLIFTIGCGGSNFVKPTTDQLDQYVKAHPNLSELDKSCLYDGRFEVGMGQETVRFLLGEPKEIEVIQQPWARQEKWYYKQGGKKAFYMEDNGVVGIEEIN